MSLDEKAARLAALHEIMASLNERRGYRTADAAQGPQSAEVDQLIAFLRTWNKTGLSNQRLSAIAKRLDVAAQAIIAERTYDGPIAARTVIVEAEPAELSDANRAGLERWRAWAADPTKERSETRGRPPMPDADDLLDLVGAGYEMLTGKRPSVVVRKDYQNDRYMGRQGAFRKFASAIEVVLGLKIMTDRRIEGTVARRKLRRITF